MGLQLVITEAGRAAVLDQAGGGFRAVRVAAVGLSPAAVRATPTATALAGETKRVATIAGEATAADTIHLTVTDETADAYAVRAFALYLSDGTVFALYGQDEVIVEKSPQALLLLALDVALVDVPAVAITFGSAAFTNPAATTQRAGVVTLATPDEARAGADRVRALTPATARGALLDWLGFTPVQQGTGLGQRANVVKIGWSGVRLLVTVDATDQGAVVFERGGDTVWRLDNDGAGSGLDADLLDGRDGADYLADRSRVAAANLDTAVANGCYAIEYPGYQDSLLAWRTASSTGTMQLAFGYSGRARWRSRIDNNRWSDWRTFWHSDNDGAGSGLDADLLDGEHASDLRDFARLLNRPATYPPAPHAHAAIDLAGAFPASLSDNGYVVLPNGLILQWLAGAQQAAGTSGAQALTLPIAFPNRCLHASVSTRLGEGAAPCRSAYFVTSVSATGVTVERQVFDRFDSRASTPAVLAIGY